MSTIRGTLRGGSGGGAPCPPCPPDPLLTHMVSWWTFDEESGNRIDVHGSNDLIPFNTPGFAIGKISNAADFISASSERMATSGSPVDLRLTGDKTIAYWNFFEGVTGERHFGIDSVTREWFIAPVIPTDGYAFFAWNSGDVLKNVNSGVVPTSGNWYMVVAMYDDVANELQISVNNSTIIKATTGATSMRTSGSDKLDVGSYSGGTSSFIDGRLDEGVVFNAILTAAEITRLYNSGAGMAYPG